MEKENAEINSKAICACAFCLYSITTAYGILEKKLDSFIGISVWSFNYLPNFPLFSSTPHIKSCNKIKTFFTIMTFSTRYTRKLNIVDGTIRSSEM